MQSSCHGSDHAALLDLLAAGLPAQVRVVVLLEALLADDVVGRVPFTFERLVFFFGDLSDVAEEMRAELVVRVIAHGLRLEVEARQLILRFGQTRHLRAREVACEDDRPVRLVGRYLIEVGVVDAAMVEQALPEQAPGYVEHASELTHRRIDVVHVAWNHRAHERRPAAHEHHAVAIVDATARCSDRYAADLIRAGRCGIPCALDELDLRQACD